MEEYILLGHTRCMFNYEKLPSSFLNQLYHFILLSANHECSNFLTSSPILSFGILESLILASSVYKVVCDGEFSLHFPDFHSDIKKGMIF